MSIFDLTPTAKNRLIRKTIVQQLYDEINLNEKKFKFNVIFDPGFS